MIATGIVYIFLYILALLVLPYVVGYALGFVYYVFIGGFASLLKWGGWFFCESLEGFLFRTTFGEINSRSFHLKFCQSFHLKKTFLICGKKSFVLFRIGFVSRSIFLERFSNFQEHCAQQRR